MAKLRNGRWEVSIWQSVRGRVHKSAIVIFSAAPFILVGVLLLLPSCSSSEKEFPAFVYNSAEVLQAYETAVRIPEVLPLMPCYCNCGEAQGHQSLKDCFFKEDGSLNDHGAFCEVCDMEVADIAKWQEEGYSLEQIRGLIDEKYPRYGEPTDTPPLSESKASSATQSPVADSTGGPRLAFDKDSVDLGKVPMDIPINYTFSFKNVGGAPLNITGSWAKALVGCCPPIPVIGSMTLEPGEESTLLIGNKPHNMTGPHEFEITVKSNDPVEPEKKLYLTVDFQEGDED